MPLDHITDFQVEMKKEDNTKAQVFQSIIETCWSISIRLDMRYSYHCVETDNTFNFPFHSPLRIFYFHLTLPGLCVFCCYQPLCVVSQQSWFGVFFCLNFPILRPPPSSIHTLSRRRPWNLAITLFCLLQRSLMMPSQLMSILTWGMFTLIFRIYTRIYIDICVYHIAIYIYVCVGGGIMMLVLH